MSSFESAATLYQRIIDEVGPREARSDEEQVSLDAILANAYFRLAYNANRFFDFDRAVEIGTGFAGTPEALAERIGALADVGVDPVMLCLDWGDIEPNESRRSLDLLAERVMPAFSS